MGEIRKGMIGGGGLMRPKTVVGANCWPCSHFFVPSPRNISCSPSNRETWSLTLSTETQFWDLPGYSYILDFISACEFPPYFRSKILLDQFQNKFHVRLKTWDESASCPVVWLACLHSYISVLVYILQATLVCEVDNCLRATMPDVTTKI